MPKFDRLDWDASQQQRYNEARDITRQMEGSMTAEFDPHSVIKELAEAGWACMACAGTGQQPMLLCQTCGGTGRIVPFASLRVVRQGIWSHADCNNTIPCDLQFADGSTPKGTTDCKGRGWVPEPDVEKACWRIFWQLPYKVREKVIYDGNGPEWCKAVLQALEKKQHE